MRRLIRETTPLAFERAFEERHVQGWSLNIQSDLYRAANHLAELTAVKLVVRCLLLSLVLFQ